MRKNAEEIILSPLGPPNSPPLTDGCLRMYRTIIATWKTRRVQVRASKREHQIPPPPPPLFFLFLRQSITVNCMSKSISNQKKTKTNYRQNASLYISTSKIVFFMLFYFLPVETDLEMESTVVGYRKGSGIGDNLACMEWVNWWVVWSQN